VEHHADAILAALGPLPKSARKPHVVVDCVNGAGSVMSPELLRRLGCRVTAIHAEPNGIFPRPPEPLPQNLGALCEAVVRHRADIGFAQDADADRLAIVNERGAPIGEDYTLVLAVDYVTRRERGPVVVNLATTRAVDDIAARRRCAVIKTRIGEVNVTEAMQNHRAVIGGEGNGGVIYPRINLARDSFTAMALVLHHIAGRARPLSRIVAALPRYTMVKKAIPCPLSRAQEVVEFLTEKHRKSNPDLTEGVKIPSPEGWVLVRPSNTEPILRIISESADAAAAEKLNNQLAADVEKFLKKR
jgi:phosphomannomutase